MSGDLETFIPLEFKRCGARRLAITKATSHNSTLLNGLARGFYWQSLIDKGLMKSGSEIARHEGLHFSVVNEFLRLTTLAPDLIERIMAGSQPRGLSLIWFQRNPLPSSWPMQREIFDRFE